jgi:cytochrome c oxidase subunit 1
LFDFRPRAVGLEWQTPSPPPTYNFEETPVVTSEPYDYRDPVEVRQVA